MFSSILTKVFGSRNDREIKRLNKVVAQINSLESEYETLSDDELKGKTAEFRERVNKGESLDDLLVEAFAVVMEKQMVL